MTDYKKKYFKIKLKYLNLKKKFNSENNTNIFKNDIVIHNKYKKKAKVIEVHTDSLPIYYTIQFKNGHEIQTISDKITKYFK